MTSFRVFFKNGPAQLIEADEIGVVDGVITLRTQDGKNVAFFAETEIVGIAADDRIKGPSSANLA